MISDAMMLNLAGTVAKLFELAGIGVIVLGAMFAAGIFANGLVRAGRCAQTLEDDDNLVANFRRMLGRAILTGLELLVAADIIRTVAIDTTLESVLVLGLIVLIRTFLSFSLEVEIDGRWPWQKKAKNDASNVSE